MKLAIRINLKSGYFVEMDVEGIDMVDELNDFSAGMAGERGPLIIISGNNKIGRVINPAEISFVEIKEIEECPETTGPSPETT